MHQISCTPCASTGMFDSKVMMQRPPPAYICCYVIQHRQWFLTPTSLILSSVRVSITAISMSSLTECCNSNVVASGSEWFDDSTTAVLESKASSEVVAGFCWCLNSKQALLLLWQQAGNRFRNSFVRSDSNNHACCSCCVATLRQVAVTSHEKNDWICH